MCIVIFLYKLYVYREFNFIMTHTNEESTSEKIISYFRFNSKHKLRGLI